MIHHADNGSVCWISSVVQLPNFYPIGSVLKGFTVFRTFDGETEMDFPTYAGRAISILPGVFKYKLEFRCNDNVFDVVGLSDAQFTIGDLYSGHLAELKFFPIYMHADVDCYLFLSSINDLFSTSPSIIATPSNIPAAVISPIEVIMTVAEYSCCDLCAIVDQTEICSVRRDHSVATLIADGMNACTMPDLNENMINQYNIPYSKLPPGAYALSHVRCVGQLARFLSPYGAIPSDIAVMCHQMLPRYGEIATKLQQNNILPYESSEINYVADEDRSFAGRWIDGVFMQPYSDFEFEVRSGADAVADLYAKRTHVYDNFRTSFDRFSLESKDMLMYLPACFDLGPTNRQLVAQRTWLEDITVRDINTKDIVLYVDIVWWVLACAEGLINRVNIDQLTG